MYSYAYNYMHFNELILRIFITDDILIEDISDDDDDDQHLTSDRASNIIRLVVTFFLTFRTIYSISDQAILLILKFMRYFIAKIGSIFQIRELSNADTLFPKTMHGCYSLLKQKKSFCVEFIACPSCHMLYDQSILAISTRRHLGFQNVHLLNSLIILIYVSGNLAILPCLIQP